MAAWFGSNHLRYFFFSSRRRRRIEGDSWLLACDSVVYLTTLWHIVCYNACLIFRRCVCARVCSGHLFRHRAFEKISDFTCCPENQEKERERESEKMWVRIITDALTRHSDWWTRNTWDLWCWKCIRYWCFNVQRWHNWNHVSYDNLNQSPDSSQSKRRKKIHVLTHQCESVECAYGILNELFFRKLKFDRLQYFADTFKYHQRIDTLWCLAVRLH